ncbi:hypothetical protein [Wenzhouxiangella marina]|uniref:Uncharacterized protein n=1 Tax=Wenzhouxiangella marina TaxID=1579979 RepID=A0A0K0XTZ4_9GAMM|nr:hypothetical protein [Wenzhouxiangella marina]AKS41153.1 hypothetical protein WM2015_772 [Wenzhouxiangella marina]MBB6088032.1 putative membrane protein [Wenzhouxiangella marina]
MKRRSDRSIGMKLLNAMMALLLLGSACFMLIVGLHVIAISALLVSVAGLATPVILSGEGIVDMISGFFEAILEGLLAIVEGITEFFSGLFS